MIKINKELKKYLQDKIIELDEKGKVQKGKIELLKKELMKEAQELSLLSGAYRECVSDLQNLTESKETK